MELFNGVEASLSTPQSSYPLIVLGNSGGSSLESLDWVVQIATKIHQRMGVSCEGFDLTPIEVEAHYKQPGVENVKVFYYLCFKS